MNIVHRLFITFLVALPYLLLTNGDEIQAETTNNVDIKQSLDEISREVNDMKAQLTTSNAETNNEAGDGDNGNNQRAILGEIEKIKKIADILETVVLPTIVDSQANAQKQNSNNHGGATTANTEYDPIKRLPKGLKLLQHHNAITTNIDDGQSMPDSSKTATQSDDN